MIQALELLICIILSTLTITNYTLSIILAGFNEYLCLVFQEHTPASVPALPPASCLYILVNWLLKEILITKIGQS